MAQPHWIVVGLGNPGREYDGTRHNAGFEMLSALAGSSANWRNKQNHELCEVTLAGETALLIKPLTFMNLSGQAVADPVRFFKIPPERLVVVQDDIDLPAGALRIKIGGGDGGHKGIRSIIECTGTKDFVRIKLGVGRPASPAAGNPDQSTPVYDRPDVAAWVLQRPKGAELEAFNQLLGRGCKAIEELASKGLLSAQNKFNKG